MRLMLDEMISPNIVKSLRDSGIDATCVRDRGLKSASDPRVWRYAQGDQRTLVTGNIAHFEKLASQADGHYGVIGLPAGGTREMQFTRIISVVEWIMDKDESFIDTFAYIDSNGVVRAQRMCANDNTVRVLMEATANQRPN